MLLPHLMWDASGLAKRYIPEPGSETVNAIFELTPPVVMIFTLLGYGELYSLFRRRFNTKHLSARSLSEAQSALEAEVLQNR